MFPSVLRGTGRLRRFIEIEKKLLLFVQAKPHAPHTHAHTPKTHPFFRHQIDINLVKNFLAEGNGLSPSKVIMGHTTKFVSSGTFFSINKLNHRCCKYFFTTTFWDPSLKNVRKFERNQFIMVKRSRNSTKTAKK